MMGNRSSFRQFASAVLIMWKTIYVSEAADLTSPTLLHHFRGRHSRLTVHERLFQSLSYHPQFPNFTLSASDIEIGSHSTTSPTASTQKGQLGVPLTLSQARVIHQLALDATHSLQRSHGHTSTVPVDTPKTCRGRQHSSSTMLFSPISYGADPSGTQDSTTAFQQLLRDFLDVSPSRPMAANITNLGGATIDLQGGNYLISEPIVIPPFFGNAHIVDGTLQASPDFPSDRWLIEIGNVDTCNPVKPDQSHDPQCSCNEFIDLTNILLDANFAAAGGVRVSRVMGTTITEVFVTGFLQVGILISNGHEVMVTNAWLAECYWSTNQWCQQNHSESVGIRIDGMDHYITNTIVFDFAKVGVEILQPANLLVGVHTWNGGGRGIVVGTKQSPTHTVRLIGCYLDFQTLNIWDPTQVLIESTFFYYGYVILHSGNQSRVDSLTMRFNYYNMNQSVVLDGTFDTIKSVSIQEEVGWAKTTKSSQRLTLSNATEWTFDFGEQLLFPKIDHVMYSIASNTIISSMARPPNGTKVTIVTSEAIDATVYVTVEQGIHSKSEL